MPCRPRSSAPLRTRGSRRAESPHILDGCYKLLERPPRPPESCRTPPESAIICRRVGRCRGFEVATLESGADLLHGPHVVDPRLHPLGLFQGMRRPAEGPASPAKVQMDALGEQPELRPSGQCRWVNPRRLCDLRGCDPVSAGDHGRSVSPRGEKQIDPTFCLFLLINAE